MGGCAKCVVYIYLFFRINACISLTVFAFVGKDILFGILQSYLPFANIGPSNGERTIGNGFMSYLNSLVDILKGGNILFTLLCLVGLYGLIRRREVETSAVCLNCKCYHTNGGDNLKRS